MTTNGTPQNGAPVCERCGAEAEIYVTPPLCAVHLDMSLLIAHAQKQGKSVTVGNLQHLLALAQGNGGMWTIEEADIERLLPEMIHQEV